MATPGPLGTLNALPAEMILAILSPSHLDLPSLTTFRRVCRTAKSMVDDLPEYRWLTTHHPFIIRAMLKASARHPTCANVYTALHPDNMKCSVCHKPFSTASQSEREWNPPIIACFYLVTADVVCPDCWHHRAINTKEMERGRDMVPMCERHLRKHLMEKRKELRKKGEVDASRIFDWERTKLVPKAKGLPRMKRKKGRGMGREVRQLKGQWVFDLQGVEEVFGKGELGTVKEINRHGLNWERDCGCLRSSGQMSWAEHRDQKTVMVPLVRKEDGGPLVACAEYHEVPELGLGSRGWKWIRGGEGPDANEEVRMDD